MKYFTPELYIDYNLVEDENLEKVEKRWQSAVNNYQNNLNSFINSAPLPVQNLVKLYLHDSPFLSYAEKDYFFEINIQKNNPLKLKFTLTKPVEYIQKIPEWYFSDKDCYWLYNELDINAESYIYRILLSSGMEFRIYFSDIEII